MNNENARKAMMTRASKNGIMDICCLQKLLNVWVVKPRLNSNAARRSQ
jgi:hypothetical protein